ncbi:PorV/PorQ family protein [candidate division KSB1 bacterium]|nr:PorV/PorQ family protein [candidate division KSB1 bacterium]
MKNLKIYSLILTLVGMILFNKLLAQSKVSAEFLLISPDARSSAMGEANVAIADNANAVFWNPAGLAFQSGKEFTASYTPHWLPGLTDDIWFGFAACKYSLGYLGTIGFSFFTIDRGSRDSEYSIAASYGTTVNNNFAIGVGLKLVQFQFTNYYGYYPEDVSANTYNKIAADLGILYRIPWLNDLRFGANLSNMGPQTDISAINGSYGSPLPTNLKFGFAYSLIKFHYNKLNLAFDFNKLLLKQSDNGDFDSWHEALFSSWDDGYQDVTYGYGIEYLYANLIALRMGYLYDDDGNRYQNNLGIGLKYSYFDFDVSVIDAAEGHPMDETIRFSLQIESLESPPSLSSNKSGYNNSDFKKAISPNLSFWCPWINDENKLYIPTISFGTNFLYRTTPNLILEFGAAYSPLSVSDDYITDFIRNTSSLSNISATECSSSLTKIMAGARFLFPQNSSNIGYLSAALATYMFGDISAKYTGIQYDYSGTSNVNGEIKIEPDDKTVFGLQFGPGTMIQSSSNIAFDLKANFHVIFGQSNASYWFEPVFSFIYLF